MIRFLRLISVFLGILQTLPATNLFPAADSIPPVIACPPNDTLTLDPTSCDTVYTYTVAVEDDQPGAVFGLVSGISSGDTFPVGITINLFLAIDASGNTASCSFTVQVVAGPGPAMTCEDRRMVQLGANCNATLTAEEMLLPPYGCPGIYLVEIDKTAPFGNGPWLAPQFNAADLGKTFQARVTDTRSQNRCWGEVQVVDSLAPVLDCPAIDVPCALPTAHLTPEFLKDTLGITAGRVTATDNCSGPAGITLTFADMSVNLPCDSPGTVTGYVHRFWTARDAAGNSATCLQVINRQRRLEDMVFPADVTVSCDDPDTAPGSTGIPYVQAGSRQYGMLAAPFCEIDVFFSDTIENLCGGSRRIHRFWSAQDACLPTGPGNPVLFEQTIDVLDTGLPVLQCPADTVLVLAADSCIVTLDMPDLIVSDHCSPLSDATVFWEEDGETRTLVGALEDFTGNNPGERDTLAAFGEIAGFPVGTTSLLYVATDVCGNIGSCSVTLHVRDTTMPDAVCDSLLTVYLDGGQYTLTAAKADKGSSDDCGILTFKIKRAEAGTCSQTSATFDDQQVFCCADAGDTIAIWLRVFDVFVPSGMVSDSFAPGHYDDCLTRVAVLDTLAPACVPPAGVTVACTDFDPGFADYGDISFTCKVDSVAQSVDYTAFDSLCSSGTITRFFRVFDQAGNSGQCSQQIAVTETMQEYWIRFPSDVYVTECSADQLYGKPELANLHCENMRITFEDEIFNVVPDACYKIERTWTLYNDCTYDPGQALTVVPNPNPHSAVNHPSNLPGPVVSPAGADAPWTPSSISISPGKLPTDFSAFWAAGANGYQYTQIIKVIDTEKPLIDQCPASPLNITDMTANDPLLWNEPYWWDATSQSHDLEEAPADLCVDASDQCAGADVTVRFLLYLDLDGDGTRETVLNSLNLPGPNTVYYNNATNPNFSGGTPRAFDLRPVPTNQKYGFALQTAIDGDRKTACLRWNTQQSPLSYTVPMLPYGTHRIQWFMQDKCGNERVCDYLFTVGPDNLTIEGRIRTEDSAKGVGSATVNVSGTHPVLPAFTRSAPTNAQGEFQFDVPAMSDYTATPKRDDDPLNGVSTFDLVLINKHVLGIDLLPTPYRIIAADANRSRTVTTFDIVELRKLILGLHPKLPASDSWRFVDKAYVFPNPANPFTDIFPESATVSDVSSAGSLYHEFVGLKVGDVNGSASPGFEGELVKRSAGSIDFKIAEHQFNAGDVFDVSISATALLSGFQFTLHLVGLEVLDIAPGAGMTTENFAVFNETETLVASWEHALAEKPAFVLRLKAKTAGRLSEQLRLSHRIAAPEAYGPDLEWMTPSLRFDGVGDRPPALELFQNEPNPFRTNTLIGFYLPAAGTATLRVIDATGRELFAYTAFYEAGLHRHLLDPSAWGDTGGVLLLQLETVAGRAVRRMMYLP